MTAGTREALSKLSAITLGFWIIKILATTFGETAGDTVSMSMNLGDLVGTAIFLTIFVALAWWQISAKRFHPALYWATIIASTTAGTAMADFATRSLGIGGAGRSDHRAGADPAATRGRASQSGLKRSDKNAVLP